MERATPWVIAGLLAASGVWTALAYTHPGPEPAARVSLHAAQGKRVWLKHNCQACHQVFGLGGYLGPDLTDVMTRRGAAYVRQTLRDPRAPMPNLNLSDEEIDRLADYLEYVDATGDFPPSARPLRGFNN